MGKTNKHYQQYLYIIDDGCFPMSDVTVQEMYLFLPINVWMGHTEIPLVHTLQKHTYKILVGKPKPVWKT
jgi:hypothetical protein